MLSVHHELQGTQTSTRALRTQERKTYQVLVVDAEVRDTLAEELVEVELAVGQEPAHVYVQQ